MLMEISSIYAKSIFYAVKYGCKSKTGKNELFSMKSLCKLISWKNFQTVIFLVLSLGVIVLGYLVVLENKHWKKLFICLFVAFTIMFILSYCIERKDWKNYPSKYEPYLKELSLIKGILRKEFSIGKKEEIQEIIEIYDHELGKKTLFQDVFAFLGSVFKLGVFPFMGFLVGFASEGRQLKQLQELLTLDTLIEIFYLVINTVLVVGPVYVLVHFIKTRKGLSMRNQVKDLQEKLKDLYVLYEKIEEA